MRSALALTALLLSLTAAAEQEKRLLVSSVFGDPSLVAPVVRYEVERGATSYAYGISGWTMEGEWTRRMTDTRALRVTADATPLNAHNSNLIYRDGVRETELEYDNAAYRARAGMRFTPTARATTDVMLVALYESVDGLTPETEQRWASPYAGLEIAHTYAIMNSREPLIGAFDGIELSARGEYFAGHRNWSRAMLVQRAGKNVGRLHFRQSIALLNGSGLDVVNRFLAGGSWDALGGTAVYGLRYGELRLERAVIASGGIDVRLPRNWRAGIRGSWVEGDDESLYGHALNATKLWKTVGVNFGVGVSERADTTFYAAIIAPLYAR